MFDLLRLRTRHGFQAIPDVADATPPPTFRGLPRFFPERCVQGCLSCVAACPTAAVRRTDGAGERDITAYVSQIVLLAILAVVGINMPSIVGNLLQNAVTALAR